MREILFKGKISTEKLKLAQLTRMRKKLSELIEQRDFLNYHEGQRLHAQYMLKIGRLEFQAYELYIEQLRLKRKSELIQVYLNQQKKIEIQQIEQRLKKELKTYQEKLSQMFSDIEKAKSEEKKTELSEEDSLSIKKLYRDLIKKLHPDLNPNLSEQEKLYYQQAVEAYEQADLETIRTLTLLVTESLENKTLVDFESQKVNLEQLIKKLEEEITEIKSDFPFTEIDLLESQEAITKRREELFEIIKDYRKEVKNWQEKIKHQMEDGNG
ncbi:MAG: hypothetical protein LBI13_03190 [Streptococcaceae bacterium]|jgi:hypothetical protein|nr:hypothetical protein [Streptococcaceae bacterium]